MSNSFYTTFTPVHPFHHTASVIFYFANSEALQSPTQEVNDQQISTFPAGPLVIGILQLILTFPTFPTPQNLITTHPILCPPPFTP